VLTAPPRAAEFLERILLRCRLPDLCKADVVRHLAFGLWGSPPSWKSVGGADPLAKVSNVGRGAAKTCHETGRSGHLSAAAQPAGY
jgi:hypothetical protein